MIKILTVIGARPQIIKASALDRTIKNSYSKEIQGVILHTGQHYDDTMSDVFFREMGISQPDYNLNVGSGTHGKQTAAMIEGIEKIAILEKPDAIVVYGDTNSTLAAAIAATKLKTPLLHIEAGLRSFNKTMPEEINRIVCDHCSTMLFTPTLAGYNNLLREGFNQDNESPFTINKPGMFHCGDVMYDNTLYFSGIAEATSGVLNKLGLKDKEFLLVTIHRDSNTDVAERLNAILEAINQISIDEQLPVVFPIHPRTSASLDKLNITAVKSIKENPLFQTTAPASFLEMILLEKKCSMVLTDSGGVQKEAFFLHKPCIVLRPETEWVELVECGNSILADADQERIKKAYYHFKEKKKHSYPLLYGEGNAADFICKEIIRNYR
jgi:UDP-GlcNAc3NAcA epimerase